MKKILALFIAVAMIASFGVGAIAGADEDAYANAVLNEQAQLALEKAAIEFANGNDVEGFAAEEDAANEFGKTGLGFNIMGGVIASAGWCPGNACGHRIHKPHCEK
ncbi:MAG: hypothetical protein AMQ74_01493 [Candidatus Methanofastidiosum methylothiophilum]|uniref:Uncharacterized protein n=1 Tax=Candidatus Methanofastidiosum methylothiophilum TaxID=1705564 RepID=A0A150IVM7_9EURY|nr:MAG: hypothetical protein AMQ74_01493 [Candidatus Methanofastidiosum methylthiophilus]